MTIITKGLLDEGVVCDGNALLADLAESTLVDELADRLQVGVSERWAHEGNYCNHIKIEPRVIHILQSGTRQGWISFR